MHAFFYQYSFFETLKSDNLKDLHVYLLLHQSLHDFTNPIGHNLISIIVDTNTFGCTLISILNSLGHNLISAIGFTNRLDCKLISVLVFVPAISSARQYSCFYVLCLAALYFNSPMLLFNICTYNLHACIGKYIREANISTETYLRTYINICTYVNQVCNTFIPQIKGNHWYT